MLLEDSIEFEAFGCKEPDLVLGIEDGDSELLVFDANGFAYESFPDEDSIASEGDFASAGDFSEQCLGRVFDARESRWSGFGAGFPACDGR